jgi:hypothetical protein
MPGGQGASISISKHSIKALRMLACLVIVFGLIILGKDLSGELLSSDKNF